MSDQESLKSEIERLEERANHWVPAQRVQRRQSHQVVASRMSGRKRP